MTTKQTLTPAPPPLAMQCDARTGALTQVSGVAFEPVRCGQNVIGHYVAFGPFQVGFCARAGHETDVRRQFPGR